MYTLSKCRFSHADSDAIERLVKNYLEAVNGKKEANACAPEATATSEIDEINLNPGKYFASVWCLKV